MTFIVSVTGVQTVTVSTFQRALATDAAEPDSVGPRLLASLVCSVARVRLEPLMIPFYRFFQDFREFSFNLGVCLTLDEVLWLSSGFKQPNVLSLVVVQKG